MTEKREHVVLNPDTETYHKSHPSMLLHLACNPEIRGTLVAEDSTEADPCQHQACFGDDA